MLHSRRQNSPKILKFDEMKSKGKLLDRHQILLIMEHNKPALTIIYKLCYRKKANTTFNVFSLAAKTSDVADQITDGLFVCCEPGSKVIDSAGVPALVSGDGLCSMTSLPLLVILGLTVV